VEAVVVESLVENVVVVVEPVGPFAVYLFAVVVAGHVLVELVGPVLVVVLPLNRRRRIVGQAVLESVLPQLVPRFVVLVVARFVVEQGVDDGDGGDDDDDDVALRPPPQHLVVGVGHTVGPH